MEILLQVLILALGFVCLIKGSDWFVDGSSSIAAKFGIPQLIIGLTIVAMGTSSPEAAVSITAALEGNADITVGNIYGSNILNIFIILGLSAAIVPIAISPSTIRYETPFLIGISILMVLLGLDGSLNLIDGLIFIAFLILYIVYLIKMAKKGDSDKKEEETQKEISIPKSIVFAVIGLALIILGSNLTVDAATKIAQSIGISERFIGLTVVALGTSLPELFTSVSAARKGNADIAIGNVVGSNLFNILFVIGLSAVITPVPFASNFIFDAVVSIIAAILLFIFCINDKYLRRWEGIVLLACYAVYFILIL